MEKQRETGREREDEETYEKWVKDLQLRAL